ncbi:non-heme iron oxygenase ferredoxin subunit [Dehalococcoidia bacterium]|nr:non-heme iron oxygenase ferredoxin subunit [Dehalococcoidia bacterium]
MAEFYKVAKVSDVPPGEMIGVDVGETKIAIANVDGEFYAFQSDCTHAAGWLHLGFLEGHNVQCPVHFAEFDMKTGDPVELPASVPIVTYTVRLQGDDLEIQYP